MARKAVLLFAQRSLLNERHLIRGAEQADEWPQQG